jgi:hypothetical protein
MMVLFFLTQFIIIIQQQSSFFILIKRSLLAADHFYAEKSIKCSMILALELTLLWRFTNGSSLFNFYLWHMNSVLLFLHSSIFDF